MAYSSGKQAVPCIFFQKGLCLKGDRCAFLHGPSNTTNKALQVTASNPSSESPSRKFTFGGLQKCTQEQRMPLKPVEAPVEAKSSSNTAIVAPRKNIGTEKNDLPPKLMDDEVSRNKETNNPLVNRNSGRSNSLHLSQVANDQSFQNNKDYDEFFKESSPGFDVLVDDDLGDSDYYQAEDQYGKKRYHDERNLDTMDEFELGHTTNYHSINPEDFDSYEQTQGQHAWEHLRASSERMLMGPAHLEGRGYTKSNSPEHISESDLRYHLSKRRRVNGLRSVVSHDSIHDDHREGRVSGGSSGRDLHHLPLHNRSIHSRLHGRIKLPGKSPNSGNDLHTEQEINGGRFWGRLSPGRQHQGRLRDRIKPRVEEDDNNEGRDIGRPRLRREIMDETCTDFAGPKSLAELKVARNGEGRTQQSFGNQKHIESHLLSDGDLSFEGPMPLSEIRKRKREAEAAASGSGMPHVNKDDHNQKMIEESFVGSLDNAALAEAQHLFPSVAKDGVNSHMLKNKEESTPATVAGVRAAAEDIEFSHGQSSEKNNFNELDTEDGKNVEDRTEDCEFEGEHQGDGDYEYEQGDEGDYTYEEGENEDAEVGENVDGEEEYVDGEDGDDFAKKIGAIFS
uniref:Zinc finger family protein n=1 Tax=Rhizophora mucronata TaxID=61149 RepID=A0A2P2IYR6_RHIMU